MEQQSNAPTPRASNTASPLHLLDRFLAVIKNDDVAPMEKVEIPQNIRREVLRVANFLFGEENSPLLDAAIALLDSLDKSTIRFIKAMPSGRSVYIVRGSKSMEYFCSSKYCSCRSFFERSKQFGKDTVCKHLLATRLAPFLLPSFYTEVVSDAEFSAFIVNRCT
mmetsp:Transcript_19868/g.30496  ORF Transcript_19868/g.30496 Transcript_19868/m.30496 type:complete len:165 (+) Transcript_19868:1-495(+)